MEGRMVGCVCVCVCVWIEKVGRVLYSSNNSIHY